MDFSLVGVSEAFIEFEQKLKRVASHDNGTVLIRAERGSGKELAAYAVHYLSARRHEPFVPVLGSAVSESLLADEFFGHERNSFTGATVARRGKFLAADRGTVFLDEVGDLPMPLQVALLRVIEQGEIQPIGRDLPIKVHVRVVAATNKDLSRLVATGIFRDDLYDRLNVFDIKVPPLRDRNEDIRPLAEYFMLKQCAAMSRRRHLDQKAICQSCEASRVAGCATEEFYDMLRAYDWPGNVRELQSLIVRLSTLAIEETLDLRHLPETLQRTYAPSNTAEPSDDLSLAAGVKRHVERVLALTENNQTKAAKILGIPRTTLQAKIRRLDIRLR